MKNATATSHGRSRLLEADGVDEAGFKLEELTGAIAMESENYSTSEWENLLEYTAVPVTAPLLTLDSFARVFGPPGRNHLYKSAACGLLDRLFLATIKRP
jgi:hypothetical protein